MKRKRDRIPLEVTGYKLAGAFARGEIPQRPDESERHYAAFRAYCEAGGGKTLAEIGEGLGGSQGWISRLKRENRWDMRIMDWQMAKVSGASELGDENAFWDEKRRALRREEWELHTTLMELGFRFIEKWQKSDKLPGIGDLAKMLDLASKLGRLAAGLPLSNAEVTVDQSAPFRIEIAAALERAYGPSALPPSEVVDTEVVG